MARPDIKVRLAALADSSLLAELGEQTFQDTFGPSNTPEDMAEYLSGSFSPSIQAAELRDPSNSFLIAELEGEPVGYARLRTGLEPADIPGSRPLEIVRFYSVTEWIGRGVGPVLMRACLDLAERAGNDTLWLDVWERNDRAIAFYRKWGFEVVGAQPFQLGRDIQRDLLMARSIRGAGRVGGGDNSHGPTLEDIPPSNHRYIIARDCAPIPPPGGKRGLRARPNRNRDCRGFCGIAGA